MSRETSAGGTQLKDGTQRRNAWRRWLVVVLALAILVAGGLYYGHRLTTWQAYDDEGGYLYASWRISLGEVPYRDFLTPQLPVFLYPGALVLRLTDFSVLAARLAMLLMTLAAVALMGVSVRRIWGDGAALLALVLAIAQADLFWTARFYRPEASMLLLGMLGTYLFLRAYPARHRAGLIAAGVAFGLSAMSKLFGVLMLGGVLLFVVAEGLRARRWRDTLTTALWVGGAAAIVGGGLTLLFTALAPEFLADVLGHHLRQGQGTPFGQVIVKALVLYRDFFIGQPVWSLLTLLGLARVIVDGRRGEQAPLQRFFAWQLPMMFAFMFMTRELQGRYFAFLVPALAALGGYGLTWPVQALWARRGPALLRGLGAGVVVAAGLALAIWPNWQLNALVAGWEEHTTPDWVAYLQAHTAPEDVIVSDYPGINFFARRATTPTAAGISRGAAASGQIMGAELIGEIEASHAEMVLMNVAQGAHQFTHLLDYPAFKQYVQTHFLLAERRRYDYRLIEVYAREDLWPGQVLDVNMPPLKLTGVHWLRGSDAAGGYLQAELRWQSMAAMTVDYDVTWRLMDDQGHVWGLGSKALTDIDDPTYWDEEGLERALLIRTSEWPASEQTIGTYELPVDAATPPGTYHVMLRVHPRGGWDGLTVLDDAGAPAGYDVDLGTVTVAAAEQAPALTALGMSRTSLLALTPELDLLGYDLSAETARPGDTLTVGAYWRAAAKMAVDYGLRLTLRDGDGRIWAQMTAAPAGEAYPTSQWPAGQILEGQYDLPIDPETPTGSYALRGQLLDGDEVVAEAPLGSIQVEGRERVFAVPTVQYSVGVSAGGTATLLGYDLADTALAPGGTLDVRLYWRGEDKASVSYTVFVHLIDGENRIWGQVDSVPVQGQYPTTGWLPEEIVADDYALAVAADAPAGAYRLEIGMYDAASGVRLPLYDADGARLADDRYLVEGLAIVGP